MSLFVPLGSFLIGTVLLVLALLVVRRRRRARNLIPLPDEETDIPMSDLSDGAESLLLEESDSI